MLTGTIAVIIGSLGKEVPIERMCKEQERLIN